LKKTLQEQILEINEILSKTSFPSWIEKEIRSLSDMGSWKAEQWKNFLLYLALPLIRKRASSHTYSFWCELTTVMLKLVSLEVSVAHIPFLKEQIFSLIQKYEIKYKIKQRPQLAKMIHLLVHMPQCILDCGPAFVFWLFPTERFWGNSSTLRKIPEKIWLEISSFWRITSC